MAVIVIRDLPESVDLDREAMVAITGGARAPGRQTFFGRATRSSSRIVNYPASLARNPMRDVYWRPVPDRPLK